MISPRARLALPAALACLQVIALALLPDDSSLRSPPRVAETSADLPVAQLVATPKVRVLLGYTRNILRLHDGYTLAVFSFSNSAPANWLFLIDGRDLSVERHAIPGNDIASHGAALGFDGNIYIAPYGNSRIHRFDVARREFTTVDVDLPASEYTWGAVGAPKGRIYFGTYPSATLCEYDPVTRALRQWNQVAPNTKYARDFSVDANGAVRFLATGPDNVWMRFDPATDTLDRSEQPPYPSRTPPGVKPWTVSEGDESFRGLTSIGSARFSVGHPSGRLWEITPEGENLLRGETEAFGEPAFWLETIGDSVVGISYFGIIFRYDTATGEFARRQMPNLAPGGNSIMFCEAIGGRWAIGANYSQQNLFRVDMDTGEVAQPPWIIARSTGEPMCAVGFGDRAYLGIYTQSILMRYNADEPFDFGVNPAPLIELGDTYKQTRPRAAIADGQRIFISSDSAYNHLGGALAVIDPRDDSLQVYHQLIQDQDLPTLALERETGLVWGGTNRWGQMRSHPPTQESSRIYAFDADAGRVRATCVLWPGSDETAVIGVGHGILVAASGSEIALVRTRDLKALYRGPSPIAIPRYLRTGSDGAHYCVSGGLMYRWDLAGNVLTAVARAPGCMTLSELCPGRWVLSDATSVYSLQISPASAD